MTFPLERPEFDYDTVSEAMEHLESMFDVDTLEGQRLFEGAMREARIREREVDTETCPVCKNKVPLDSLLSYNNEPNQFCQDCVDSGNV